MISVILSRSELMAHGPCDDGIKLFDSVAQDDKIEIKEWTQLHSLMFAVTYPSFHFWMRGRNLIPTISFYGANLRGADLRGADLYGADLYGANLYGANLYGAERCSTDDKIVGWTNQNGFLVSEL